LIRPQRGKRTQNEHGSNTERTRYCGGNVLWQNPQVALLSPVYPLAAVVSLPLAVKITIALHVFLSFIGMHLLLTRVFRLSFLPAVLFLSSLFTLAGAPALHIKVGHPWFLSFYYLPLLAFFFLLAMQTGRLAHIFCAAAISALAVYNGGLHAAAPAAVAVILFSIFAAVARRDWRPLAVGIVFGLAAVAYSAPRLVPVAMFVTGDRFVDARGVPERPDRTTLEAQARAFLDRDQGGGIEFPGRRHGWHEYGDYIGLFGALLIVSSIVWILSDRPWQRDRWLGVLLALTSLVLLLLALGDFSAHSPYTILNMIPPFTRFRNPSRYVLVFNLFAAATAAWAAAAVAGEGGPVRLRRFLAILFVLASFDLAHENRRNFEEVFSQPPLQAGFSFLKPSGRLVQDTVTSPYGPNSPMLRAMLDGRGVVDCYESLQLQRAVDPAQDLVFSDGSARIFKVSFTPNRIEFTALPGAAGARVFLNQNYTRGWTSDAGVVALDERTGRAYVSLRNDQAGQFSFTFVPPGIWTGLLLFATGIGMSVVGWTWKTNTERTQNEHGTNTE